MREGGANTSDHAAALPGRRAREGEPAGREEQHHSARKENAYGELQYRGSDSCWRRAGARAEGASDSVSHRDGPRVGRHSRRVRSGLRSKSEHVLRCAIASSTRDN